MALPYFDGSGVGVKSALNNYLGYAKFSDEYFEQYRKKSHRSFHNCGSAEVSKILEAEKLDKVVIRRAVRSIVRHFEFDAFLLSDKVGRVDLGDWRVIKKVPHSGKWYEFWSGNRLPCEVASDNETCLVWQRLRYLERGGWVVRTIESKQELRSPEMRTLRQLNSADQLLAKRFGCVRCLECPLLITCSKSSSCQVLVPASTKEN